MTVKEHDSRKQRSLSLCSISEHMSGDQLVKENQASPALNLKSPAELRRKAMNVVLTPMGNESNGGCNLANMNSLFRDQRI